jgi:hypothetical protein
MTCADFLAAQVRHVLPAPPCVGAGRAGDADPNHSLSGWCVASAAITATSRAMITSDQIG